MTAMCDELRKQLEEVTLQRDEATRAAEEAKKALQERESQLAQLREDHMLAITQRDEALAKLKGLERRVAELELIEKDRDNCLLEIEDLKRQCDELRRLLAFSEEKAASLAQSLQEKEATLNLLSADLESVRKQNDELRLLAERQRQDYELQLAQNKEELERLLLALQEAQRARDEAKKLHDAAEKACRDLRQELDKRDAILRETRASLAKAAAENADLAAQIAELKKVLAEKDKLLMQLATQRELLIKWVKKQRGGLSKKFEDALDSWMKSRVFGAWRHLNINERIKRLTNDANARLQAAVDSASMDARCAAQSQEEAHNYLDELNRLRKELRDVKAKLHEMEKLKEVDIKLEVMTRERRLRDMLDQRPESLPLMPDTPAGMMPSPPSGEPTYPGSGRSLSQCARLPPTNHYSRAEQVVRDTPTPGPAQRPHTSMDAHTSRHTEWMPSMQSPEEATRQLSPDGSRQSTGLPAAQTPQQPHSARARHTPRRQRGQRHQGRSLPSRRRHQSEGNDNSDLWAFVNFGTPMTDSVMYAEVPLPKPMRRLVARDGQTEAMPQ